MAGFADAVQKYAGDDLSVRSLRGGTAVRLPATDSASQQACQSEVCEQLGCTTPAPASANQVMATAPHGGRRSSFTVRLAAAASRTGDDAFYRQPTTDELAHAEELFA